MASTAHAANSGVLTPAQLERVQRERRLATTAGIAGAIVSGAANLIASDGGPIGWAVAAVAPAAFVLSAELAAMGSLGTTVERSRSAVAAAIALAAAIVSFGHLREVVLEVGESGLASVLIPLVVDAVVLMGLVTHRTTGTQLQRHETAVARGREASERRTKQSAKPVLPSPGRGADQRRNGHRTIAATSTATERSTTAVATRRPIPAETRELHASRPELTHAQLADQLGISTKTVQRHLRATEQQGRP